MNYILFAFFSSLEYLAAFALAFALFRFNFSGYWAHALFTCLLLSYISYTTRFYLNLDFLSPLIQMIVFIISIWLLFRVQVVYAAIMGVVGYVGYGLFLNGVSYLLVVTLRVIPIERAIAQTGGAYVLQTVAAISVFLIYWIIKRFNLGFSFVPHSEFVRIKLKGENVTLIIMTLLTIAVFIFVSMQWINTSNQVFFTTVSIFAPVLVAFLYFAFRRERTDD